VQIVVRRPMPCTGQSFLRHGSPPLCGILPKGLVAGDTFDVSPRCEETVTPFVMVATGHEEAAIVGSD
jgi:hypothetical protein